jgi:DNA-binding response OmpR family regulator
MKLLLVEDDPELGRQMQNWMREGGHHLHWQVTCKGALTWLAGNSCDAAIIDVGLPDGDGFNLVSNLRSKGWMVPLIFLTAHASVQDRVRGLAVGGDDYLTKPFAAEELLARLQALYRRVQRPSQQTTLSELNGQLITVGNSKLSVLKRRIHCGGKEIELQTREWMLLETLLQYAGDILTKPFLLEKVWQIRFDPGTNVVDAMICRLRRKLEGVGSDLQIETIRGKGYVYHPPS